jgi:flagellar basal-body rod protein FlgB
MDLTDTQTSRVLSKALDGLSERHEAILSNIANAETPGYKALQVSFEDNLRQAINAENNPQQTGNTPAGSLKTTNPLHINPNAIAPETDASQISIERSQFMYRYDQNGVDIEHEMAQLSKNAQRYDVLAKLENKEFSTIHSAIKEGGS